MRQVGARRPWQSFPVDTVEHLWLDLFSRGAATIFGLFLFIATTISLLRTAVVPRALRSVISDAVTGAVRSTFWSIARVRKDYYKRDAVLAWSGPMIIVMWLISWLLLYMVAYGLWIYGLGGGGDIWAAIKQSGSSLFTLGFATPNNVDVTALDFAAAATGPIVIALMIGFLPTIYGAYVDREVDVTLLGATAGQPAWGPELLSRLSMSHQVDDLQSIYADWKQWSAEIRLTHVTYSVLVDVRSSKPTRNWVISLMAVMDAAALQLSVNRTLPRPPAVSVIVHGAQTLEVIYADLFVKQAKKRRIPFVGLFLSQPEATRTEHVEVPGITRSVIAVEIASASDSAIGLPQFGIEELQHGEEAPITLTREEFDKAISMLKASGFPVEVEGDDAWAQFKVARARYEFPAHEIAKKIDAVPAPWSGNRRIPTPVIWPTLATDVMDKLPPGVGAPADSATNNKHSGKATNDS